jgi:hypothetical protein
MPTSTDGVKFTGLTATTTAAFGLKGGKYGIAITATGAGPGTAAVQVQTAAGTFVPVNAGVTAAPGGYAVVDLPAGQYNFTTTVLTAVSVSITAIPS